ncbi:transposase [Thiohalocapsa sp.]|uniref:REP-associated tyrosine transposase n=1 Tax=Thiohalocapsa sp. TaxID=2497641 RepID=UPI0025D81E11|nr:transposase [Thiohalocapsa sp.]
MPPKGWHSRGYLPHLDVPGLLQSITFHLEDSLPKAVMKEILAATEPGDPERLRCIERWLDAGHGECWLRRPEIGTLVQDALLHFDGERYRMLAWVLMPNHVHCLIETSDGHALGDVVQSWKSFTAKQANRLLGRFGTFWERDYFDRYIRDDRHLAAVVRYIERNPVKAGLVARAEDWPFGSARLRGLSR